MKIGLCIGINYNGTKNKLMGCHNDALQMNRFLNNNGFETSILLDDDIHPLPSKKNIFKEFDLLLERVNNSLDQNNCIVIHYSGHGASTRDISGDELDGLDELICTLDSVNGVKMISGITDDVLMERFISKLPSGTKCFCLFDCCHSGTILDLPYHYSVQTSTPIVENNYKLNAEVLCISGCKDKQCSADAYVGNEGFNGEKYAGAMTFTFFRIISESINVKSLETVTNEMVRNLKECGYPQIPQITMSHKNIIKKPIGYFLNI
jgi:hypothetical protein